MTITRARRINIHRKYRLTVPAYRAMLAVANESCMLCGDHTEEFSVDHNHQTGEVRGLLCNPCNLGLGYFKDSILRLQKAIDYLEVQE
jgi:hypothetical protein